MLIRARSNFRLLVFSGFRKFSEDVPRLSCEDQEASSSSTSSPERKILAQTVDILLDQCKQLREKVESVRSLNTLTFYSRAIHAAFEAIQTMINRFSTMFEAVEADEIKACEYCCEKACEIYKEIINVTSNVILTGSSTNKSGGDSKKVPMWKKQCGKNIDKIESLIKNPSLRVNSTWLDACMSNGVLNGVSGILASVDCILTLKEFEDEKEFITIAEKVFQYYEKTYREIMNEKLDIALQGIKDEKDQLEEPSLKNSQEEEALEKLEEDDIPKRYKEGITATNKNSQEENTQLMNFQEAAAAIEELQGDDMLTRFQQEITAMLMNLQLEETGQKKTGGEDTQREKYLQAEGEVEEKLQETETHKKLDDDERLKNSKEKILAAEDEIKNEKCSSGSE